MAKLSGNPIFVLGAPRSGTTFVTYWIGEHCDHIINEWHKYQLDTVREWQFPAGQLVFKWCHLFEVAHHLVDRFPTCKFVEVQRDPLNVINSMVIPKIGSEPPRTFETLGSAIPLRTINATKWWLYHVRGCRDAAQLWKDRWIAVQYERLREQREELSDFLGCRLRDIPEFQPRNVDGLRLHYDQAGNLLVQTTSSPNTTQQND